MHRTLQYVQEDNTSFSSFESEKEYPRQSNLDTAFFSVFSEENLRTQQNE